MLIAVLLSSLLVAPAWLQAEGPVEHSSGAGADASRITDVVVFPNHAEVTREIVVDAVAGENRVLFSPLVPGLGPQSLRASVPTGGRVTGTELRTVHLTSSLSEEIAQRDAEIRALEDELASNTQALARRGEEAALYKSIKERFLGDASRELAEGAVSVDAWKDVLGFVRDGLSETDEASTEVKLRMRGLDELLTTRRAERSDLAGRQPKQMKEVAVAFIAERAGPMSVQIHYIVDAVIWQPSYDVHLDRASREVGIVGYGQISQWTGEAWTDVRLTLAMSRPDAELSLPALTPMVASLDAAEMQQLAKDVTFLSRSARGQAREWSEQRFGRRQDRETFRRNLEQLARNSQQALAKLGLSRELIEDALDALVDRFAGVRYAVEGRETIPYGTSSHKVVTFQASVPAELKFVATPALGDTVMLLGEVLNTTGYPVLDGPVSLFVDGSYVGISAVQGAAQNERMVFGFGPDDALVVQRRLLSRETKGPEAFRMSQVISYHYEITVENFDDLPVEVEVGDQIPVSTTDDIQITFLGSTIQPGIETKTGVLRWPIQVAAGQRLTLEYAFSVECPVEKEVHWK